MNSRYLFFGFVIVVLALSVLLAGCGKGIVDGKKTNDKGALKLPDKPQSSEQPPALPAEGAPPAPPSGGGSGQKASGLPLIE